MFSWTLRSMFSFVYFRCAVFVVEQNGRRAGRICLKCRVSQFLTIGGCTMSKNIETEHVSNTRNHKNEDFSVSRKVNILTY